MKGPYLYKGKKYQYLRELPSKVGITTIAKRLHNGWTVEDAVDTPPNSARLFNYKGQMLTADQLPLACSYQGFWSRIDRGWTVDAAVETPNLRDKRYSYNGEMLRLSELPRPKGVPIKTVAWRLSVGWSIEDATTKQNTRDRRYEYNGKMYALKQLPARVSIYTLRDRLASGWSVEDAVDTPGRTRGRKKSQKTS